MTCRVARQHGPSREATTPAPAASDARLPLPGLIPPPVLIAEPPAPPRGESHSAPAG